MVGGGGEQEYAPLPKIKLIKFVSVRRCTFFPHFFYIDQKALLLRGVNIEFHFFFTLGNCQPYVLIWKYTRQHFGLNFLHSNIQQYQYSSMVSPFYGLAFGTLFPSEKNNTWHFMFFEIYQGACVPVCLYKFNTSSQELVKWSF